MILQKTGLLTTTTNSSATEKPPQLLTGIARLLGNQENDKKPEALYPAIPTVLVHGTNDTGNGMLPYIHYSQNVEDKQRVFYRVRDESINKCSSTFTYRKNTKTIPAPLAILRDIGSLRIQLLQESITQKLQPIHQQLTSNPPEALDRIAETFRLTPDTEKLLAPLIAQYVIRPVFEVPDPLKTQGGIDTPLKTLTQDTFNTLRKGLPKKYNADIIDSFQLGALKKNPSDQDLHPVTLKHTALIEGYLAFMEEELARALKTNPAGKAAFNTMHNTTSMEPTVEWTEQTAAKLMQQVVPQVNVVGHSQGGVVLHASLLDYLRNKPTETLQQIKKLNDSPGILAELSRGKKADLTPFLLPVRGIGMFNYVNTPLSGVPIHFPFETAVKEGLHKILDSPHTMLRRTRKLFGRPLKAMSAHIEKPLWWVANRKVPAAKEMREDSKLMAMFRHQTDLTETQSGPLGLSLFAIRTMEDGFLGSQANRLPVDLKNAMNIPVFVPNDNLENYDFNKKNPYEWLLKLVGLNPNHARIQHFLKTFQPDLKDVFERHQHIFNTMDQHNYILKYPQTVWEQVGKTIVQDRTKLLRLLDPKNFEPLRAEILKRMLSRFELKAQSAPPEMWQQYLQEFVRKSTVGPFSILNSLDRNAQEALPTSDSASWYAKKLLTMIHQAFADTAPHDTEYPSISEPA